jgi:hypothetical protein
MSTNSAGPGGGRDDGLVRWAEIFLAPGQSEADLLQVLALAAVESRDTAPSRADLLFARYVTPDTRRAPHPR